MRIPNVHGSERLHSRQNACVRKEIHFSKMSDFIDPVINILVEYVTSLQILVQSSVSGKERSKVSLLTLKDISEMCKCSDPSKLSYFWILDTTSSSTPVYVRVLNDDYLRALCNLHIAGGAINLTFRAQCDSQSPNSSPKTSPTTATPTPKPLNEVDPFTLGNIDSVAPEDLVNLPCPDGFISVEGESLLEFINHEICAGTSVFRVQIVAYGARGKRHVSMLTQEVWNVHLIRAHKSCMHFSGRLCTLLEGYIQHEQSQRLLEQDLDLVNRLRFFHRDLVTYGHNKDAQCRLDSSVATFYMSTLYFTLEQKARLMDFVTARGVRAEDALRTQLDSRSAGADHPTCTAHTLAPLIAEVYGLSRNYHEKRSFVDAYKSFGKATRKVLAAASSSSK